MSNQEAVLGSTFHLYAPLRQGDTMRCRRGALGCRATSRVALIIYVVTPRPPVILRSSTSRRCTVFRHDGTLTYWLHLDSQRKDIKLPSLTPHATIFAACKKAGRLLVAVFAVAGGETVGWGGRGSPAGEQSLSSAQFSSVCEKCEQERDSSYMPSQSPSRRRGRRIMVPCIEQRM